MIAFTRYHSYIHLQAFDFQKSTNLFFLSTLIRRNIEEKLSTKVILDGKDSRQVASPSAILPIQNNCLETAI